MAIAEARDPSAPVMGEPDATGRFGRFGGRFVPETLVPACAELEAAFREAWADAGFRSEYRELLTGYAGRPSALTECRNLSEQLGLRLLLKREDL
ncbi:MAG: tryptophan synthase subunit beta, partial [Acidimicrobiia bacterium]|nr:tryptophan synthase subunit beta [Acidimicrobiia bacterium]